MPAVTPSEPTVRLERVASFKPGKWNGETFTAADVRSLFENFKRFSEGEQPYYAPYVSLNHDDGLSFGRVVGADLDGDTLQLTADVPASVAQLVKDGKLQAPSVEFWDGQDFTDAEGRPAAGRVLKCLTLLGNQPPAVKGLGPLPAAKFASKAKARRFAAADTGAQTMDRAAMLSALQAAGLDVSAITDAVPDEVLKAILDFVQTKLGNPTPTPDTTPGDPTQMADATPTAVAVPTTGTGGGPQPSAITLKFADAASARAAQGLLAGMQAQLNQIRANSSAVQTWQTQQLAAAKAAKVRAFRDEMTGVGRDRAFMTPAQFAAVEPLLLAADDVQVRKFADGKATGTALDEAFAGLRAAYTAPVKSFGDKVPDPHRGPGAAPGPALTPERRAQILKGSPIGRVALAAKK